MLRILFALLIGALPAAACIWDRDTLREEAKGRLDTVKVITGWFDRYPPRYYEMRLERVTRELESDPRNLDLYDDAGVACDRLGRYDDAIGWMEKKKVMLDDLPSEGAEMDRYRYHSNLGSFLGNRWATKPEKERDADSSDLRSAADEISEALRLNPDAHFGREVYQLQLFEWLLLGFGEEPVGYGNFLYLRNLSTRPNQHAELNLEEAEAGLAGLIHLGSAWESIDVFDALGAVVQADGASSVAALTSWRIKELWDAGNRSLNPMRSDIMSGGRFFVENATDLQKWYSETMAKSAGRRQAWLAYQEERFEMGRHPDTDPDFWNDWKEPAFPKLLWNPIKSRGLMGNVQLVFVGLALAAIAFYFLSKYRSKRKSLAAA